MRADDQGGTGTVALAAGVKEPDWMRALRLRSQALNTQYGIGGTGTVTPNAPAATPPPAWVPPPDSIVGNVDQGGQFPPNTFAAPTWSNLPASISLQGYDPNYAALLASDPLLISSLSDVENRQGQLSGGLSAAIQQAIIRSGYNPGTGAAVDQATLDAAAGNQFSTKQEIQRSSDRAQADLDARLAARGILSSGALTGGTQRIQENYDRSTQAAIQSLLDAITGYTGDFNSASFQLMLQKAGLTADAAARIAADPRYQPVASGTAKLDPVSGLYVTADGRWYTADGVATTAPNRNVNTGAGQGTGGGGGGGGGTPEAPAPVDTSPGYTPPPLAQQVGVTNDPNIYLKLGRKMDPRYDL